MTKINQLLSRTLFAVGLTLVCTLTHAQWGGVVGGKIAQVHTVSTSGNADFRVYLVNSPVMCTGAIDPSWVFINNSNPNYKAIVANVLLAYSLNKTVTFYSNKSTTGPAGYCEIGYMVMAD
jgi:hypothetical protein